MEDRVSLLVRKGGWGELEAENGLDGHHLAALEFSVGLAFEEVARGPDQGDAIGHFEADAVTVKGVFRRLEQIILRAGRAVPVETGSDIVLLIVRFADPA